MARKPSARAMAETNFERNAASPHTQEPGLQRHTTEDLANLSNAEIASSCSGNADPLVALEEQAQYLIGWYDSTMDASYWYEKRHDIPAHHAAQILSGSNPNDPQDETRWLEVTTWNDHTGGIPLMSPGDKRKLLWALEEVGGKRTLIEWLNLAKQRGWRYDPWVDEYIAALNTFGAHPSHQSMFNNLATVKSTKVDQGVKEKVESASKARSGGRRDQLTPVIEAAQKECEDPFDTPAVWQVLRQFAQASKSPLVGVTEDGIKWSDANDDLQFFKFGNLRDRLRRSRKRTR